MSYGNYDLTTAASRIQDILSGLPLSTSSFRSASLQQHSANTNIASSAGDAARAQGEKDTTTEFVSATDVMAQMNEAMNSNVYLMDALAREVMRVSNLDSNAKRGIYKVRQDFMYAAFMTEYYRFMTNITMYTMTITLILLCLTAGWRMDKIPEWIFYIISAVLLIVYAVSMFTLFRHAAIRRNYQWNKYYWKVGSDVKRETQESNSRFANSNRGSCSTP